MALPHLRLLPVVAAQVVEFHCPTVPRPLRWSEPHRLAHVPRLRMTAGPFPPTASAAGVLTAMSSARTSRRPFLGQDASGRRQRPSRQQRSGSRSVLLGLFEQAQHRAMAPG